MADPTPPPDVVALAAARADARAAREFAAADRLRDEIAAAGWVVTDGPDGPVLNPKPPYDVLADLRGLVATHLPHRATVSVVGDGWPDDVRTCLDALLTHTTDDVVVQVLDLGNVDGAGDVVHEFAGPRVSAWHLATAAAWRGGSVGWADARRALLRADTARIHVWCDLSSVLTGDAVTPLLDAIDADDNVVAAGWRGVNVDVANEWRSFTDAGPGDVDALLGYLMAMRRDAAIDADVPQPKARFYRNADMEASFALRAARPGARIVVPAVELPVRQDRHRGYHDTDPAYRDRESAKTYQRFLQQYRGRTDLLAPRPP
ncbi:MAG: hypothetical protein QOC82_1668 [Frankiaceae bacterium]|nr:hypothetical protein [Frankiaceae bacterium]